MWLTVEEPQLRSVIDEALDTVEAVARADFWTVAKSAEHHAEVPFCLDTGGPGSAPTITNGVVDLVHRAADHWNIVDYKTDRTSAPAAGSVPGANASLPRDMARR